MHTQTNIHTQPPEHTWTHMLHLDAHDTPERTQNAHTISEPGKRVKPHVFKESQHREKWWCLPGVRKTQLYNYAGQTDAGQTGGGRRLLNTAQRNKPKREKPCGETKR